MKTIGVVRGPIERGWRPDASATDLGLLQATLGGGNACPGAPPHSAIELAMDLIAVGEGLGTQLARRACPEKHVLRGAHSRTVLCPGVRCGSCRRS